VKLARAKIVGSVSSCFFVSEKHFFFYSLKKWQALWIAVMICGNENTFRVRTSSGTFLRRGRDKIIKTIEKRIADYTFIPAGIRDLDLF